MPEDNQIQVILLAGVFLLLVVILLVLGAIVRGLARLERRIGRQAVADPTSVAAPAKGETLRKTEQKEDFMEFIREDPERRQLPKREQFAAYREWRKDKGLNWPRAGGNAGAA